MTEHMDPGAQPDMAWRRRVILGAAIALCGMAVGSDAQGEAANSARTSQHQEIELNANRAGGLPYSAKGLRQNNRIVRMESQGG
jgi:ABC-type phosphonate transport system ATPase subunit